MNGEKVAMATMDEQKYADKVKPKFHEGEWVVWQDKCYKVNYNGCGYELVGQNGLSTSLEYGTIDESAHLWTIQDAKDGDVLVVPPVKGSEHSEQIFIFKEIKDRGYVRNCVEYYCRVVDNEFCVNEKGFMGQSDDYFVPATKEQRDILMIAMADAGWEFDFEKKELKKIEQKADWSEEDDYNVQCLVAKVVSDIQKGNIGRNQELIDWLKSLKERYTWKPSDEQMDALESAVSSLQSTSLESLYQNLKRL